MRPYRSKMWLKLALLAGTIMVGLLPSGCETAILRFATPFLL
jgi:hypothetical protein